MWVVIVLLIVALALLLISAIAGTSAKRNMPQILRELDKQPLNVSGLVGRTKKSRTAVLGSLLKMQDEGYIRTGTKGGMKKISAIGDHTIFYITEAGRDYLHSV